MILSLGKQELVEYVSRQLDHSFPDNSQVNQAEIGKWIDIVLDRVGCCFQAIHNRYFQVEGQARFDHLHSDQYAIFLYFLANTLFRENRESRLCDKIFYLNKQLHGIDVFYEVELPDIFLFCHPLGTILGRAMYSNYLLIYQQVSIGAAREATIGKNIYPVLGEYLAVYAGAAIFGNCHVGHNCKISAHSLLIDQDLEDNSIYIGNRSSHIIKQSSAPDNIWGVVEDR